MDYRDYNNDFFGWYGGISRKNYAINIFIVSGLFLALSFVNFSVFEPFIPFKFLLSVVIFLADLLKFVLVMSALSLIFRRISDFSSNKSYLFKANIKKFFALVFVFPVFYLMFLRYFLGFIPVVTYFLDLLSLLLAATAIICAVIFCFVKKL